MRRIPVDVPALGDMRFIQSETRTDPEGKPVLRDGVKVQRVSVLAKPRGERPEVLEISVRQDEPIRMNDNEKIRVDNLTAMPWNTDGRSGIAFNADSIKPLNAPSGPGPVKL